MTRYALKTPVAVIGSKEMYLAKATSPSGHYRYTDKLPLVRTFPTREAAKDFCRKNERGWGWDVVVAPSVVS